MHVRKLTAALAAVPLLFASTTGVAMADTVANNLDASVDATAETMSLTAGGSTGSTQLRVIPANEDGKNGCNLAGSSVLDLDLSNSNAAVATVSPTSVRFTSCDEVKTLTVTPLTQGSITISASLVRNTTEGSFNLAPATFTVNVAAAQQQNPCASAVAPAAPTVSFNLDGTAATPNGNAGWYRTVPTVSATSATSGVTIEYSTDGTNFAAAAPALGQGITTVTAKATNGCNLSSTGTATARVDTIAPIIPEPSLIETTWRNTDLSRDFTASDTGGSGLATATDASFTLTASGNSALDAAGDPVPTVATKTVADVAGNETTRTVSALIDIELPTGVAVTGINSGAEFYPHETLPTGSCASATDALSGLASSTGTPVRTGPVSGVYTYTCSATDKAGNTASDAASVTVKQYGFTSLLQPVDQSGVFNRAKAGSAIPVKFRLSSGVTSTAILDGDPTVKSIACPNTATFDLIEETVSTNTSGLQFSDGVHNYVWKSPTTYAGKCFELTVTLKGGEKQTAKFHFTK